MAQPPATSRGRCAPTYTLAVPVTPAPLAVETGDGLPAAYALHPAYPNPFNPAAALRFDLPEAAEVNLTVYDLLGREMIRLADGWTEPGYHQVSWWGRDMAGREVPSGVYIARLFIPPNAGSTPVYTKSIKLVLLK